MSSKTRQALDSAMQLALQRHQAGDLVAAEEQYGKVLALDATHPGALHNLGIIRLSRGDTDGALMLLGAAVEQRPAEPAFQFNLGLAQQTSGELELAATAYRQAVKLNPAYRKAWENLGVVLQDQQHHDEAIAAYRRALTLDAGSVLARQNLGNALRALGRLQEAEAEYRAVLDLQPLQADAAVQLGATRLMRGDFSGWDDYEWRYWSSESLAGSLPWPMPLPKWDGGDLAGRTIHLYGEQGIGDEIMFASCVADMARRAAQVKLWCEPRLAPLFARSFPGVEVLAKPRGGLAPLLEPQANETLRCSLASLPRFLRRAAPDFPGSPYLAADAVATARWRERFAALGGRRVIGISWRGGGAPRAREARSIALEQLAPLFAIEGVRIVDLQYGDHREEIARFNAGAANPLARFDDIDPLRDMDGFAAAIAALDAVVCVDNSTAHLAGALGVPTLLLLPFQADWRWEHGREASPWYASLRLLWQQQPGPDAWPSVVQRASEQLSNMDGAGAQVLSGGVAAVAAPGVARPDVDAAPDILLLNDTSYWYHWGCTCTSLALHESLRERGLTVDPVHITHLNALAPLPVTVAQFDDDAFFEAFRAGNPGLISRLQAASRVMVNGEGSLHDFGITARALLYLIYIAAKRMGKAVHIVNHSCYPATAGDPTALDALYRMVYSTASFVAVREEKSLARLTALGIEATPTFDCLPLYAARHPVNAPRDMRRVVMAGCVQLDARMVELLARLGNEVLAAGCELIFLAGANAWLAQDDALLLAALHPRLRGRYRLVAATSEAEWLETIAGAGLLISGRFHHSIAAAAVGTALLIAGSNTAKNEGLIDRLGLNPDAVWMDAGQPDVASARLAALLRDPAAGTVDPARLAQLRELANRNFEQLPAR
jgi:Flp pilus assembly protein TadD/polysaccharide pyruvyl transferase WcaK-like protein